MNGPLGVVYLLHFSQPYQHARHYCGTSESSAFLKEDLAADGREFAELAGAVSELPTEKPARCGCMPCPRGSRLGRRRAHGPAAAVRCHRWG
jgi:hypothetical protein